MTQQRPEAIKAQVVGWIDQILEGKGWSGTQLARKAGLAPSTILRMLNDPTHNFTPSLTTLRKIAQASNLDIPRNLMEVFDIDRLGPDVEGRPERLMQHQIGKTARPFVRVRRISSLPQELQPPVDQEVIVNLPPQLEGDETVFAFHLPDDTLAPWAPAGTLAFATQKRDPKKDDVVVLTRGDGRSSVRVVVDVDARGVVVSKSLPAKEDEIVPFKNISDIAVVTMWYRT